MFYKLFGEFSANLKDIVWVIWVFAIFFFFVGAGDLTRIISFSYHDTG